MLRTKKFFASLMLHLLNGIFIEKSKLYYPYTSDRNLLLMRTDLFKFYLSTSFIFLGCPYLMNKLSPNRYTIIQSHVEHRYRSRNAQALQIGSSLLGISLTLTGFCLSYIPIYLAISPILFIYSIAAGYTAYIFYHVFGKLFLPRMHFGPIQYVTEATCKIDLVLWVF